MSEWGDVVCVAFPNFLRCAIFHGASFRINSKRNAGKYFPRRIEQYANRRGERPFAVSEDEILYSTFLLISRIEPQRRPFKLGSREFKLVSYPQVTLVFPYHLV